MNEINFYRAHSQMLTLSHSVFLYDLIFACFLEHLFGRFLVQDTEHENLFEKVNRF